MWTHDLERYLTMFYLPLRAEPQLLQEVGPGFPWASLVLCLSNSYPQHYFYKTSWDWYFEVFVGGRGSYVYTSHSFENFQGMDRDT